MLLEIVTPEKKLFTGKVEMVILPGTTGSFEILMNHAPMISTLRDGRIKVKDVEGVLTYFEIRGGVAEVVNNTVVVLVDAASIL